MVCPGAMRRRKHLSKCGRSSAIRFRRSRQRRPWNRQTPSGISRDSIDRVSHLPSLGLPPGLRRHLLEPEEERLLERRYVRRGSALEAVRLDLLAENVLTGPYMLQNKLRASPFHPVEIDHDQTPLRLECLT